MNGSRAGTARAAIVGGGVIGGGWVARFLLHGWDVNVFDPKPDARELLERVLENARIALPALADVRMPTEGKLEYCSTLAAAVRDADWIQESVPEDLALKHRVLASIEEHAPANVIIASSTSGFRPSQLQQKARHPGRILVAHPFNPVYMLPLVELVGGPAVDAEIRDRAGTILASIGMKPLPIRAEIDAHIADRLLEAVWREALWLVNDDIATTAEIDDAIRYGFGLRWAQMGLFETYRLAGGEAGMAHFIKQFGPALKWPWTKLTDVPDLNAELVQKIADQSDAQSGHYSVRQLERIRDRNLVGMLRSLKERDWGAGAVLNEHDRRLRAGRPDRTPQTADSSGPLQIMDAAVLPGWIDYNGHMTEHRYVQVFGETTDRLLAHIGVTAEYLARGYSYYTAEAHIMYLDEIGANEAIYTTSQVLMADTKRLHVFHRLHATRDNRLLASAEEMFLHVDKNSGTVSDADPAIVEKVRGLAEAHSKLPRPDNAGRHVGMKKRG